MYNITAIWDEEAKVWSVDESDIPGLSTFAATLEELQAKLQQMAPELLELNSHLVANGDPREIPISLHAHYETKFRAVC